MVPHALRAQPTWERSLPMSIALHIHTMQITQGHAFAVELAVLAGTSGEQIRTNMLSLDRFAMQRPASLLRPAQMQLRVAHA